MKKQIIAYVLAAGLAAGLLNGCGSSSQKAGEKTADTRAETQAEQTLIKEESAGSQASAEESRETAAETAEGAVVVTYVKAPLNVPSIVEKDRGILAEAFRPLNLTVEYSDLTTGPEQTQALASGDIQFLYAVGATSVILSASNGADIKIISAYSRSPKAFKLFSGDDSIRSPKDLKGKKVAGPKGTILHELLVAYLKTEGMTENDIEFVSMGIPDSQAALVGGSVDAALLAGPAAYNMEKEGYPVVTDGEGLTDATIVVAASGAYCESHPEVVRAFLEGQKNVLAYMEQNYDQVMETAARETELSIEAVKEMVPLYDFDMEIRDQDVEAMKKTEQFMKDNGMIEEDVDIESLILPQAAAGN